MIKSRFCLCQLPLLLNGDAVLSAETLAAFFSLETLQQQVRQRAATSLHNARQQRVEMRARDRRLLTHRHRRQSLCAKRVYQRAQVKGAKASLQWLVDEHRWEQEVVQRLMEKTCKQLANHLRAQLPSLPWEKVLQQQLPEVIADMASTQQLVLRLPTSLLEKAQSSLSHLPLTLTSLAEDEGNFALLENDTARVAIPLGAQLDGLINQLLSLNWQGDLHGGY